MNHYLVADIGGTNARVGLVTSEGNEIFGIEYFSNRDFATLGAVIQAFLGKAQCALSPKKACFAVASPVAGDRIHFTNNSWSFSIEALKNELGLDHLHVMNDFEAVARSLPYLSSSELIKVGGGTAKPHQTYAVLGAGTGLGMAGLVSGCECSIPLATEGGHAAFAPSNEREEAVARFLRKKLGGFVSNEDLLSGQGLMNIYEGLAFHRGFITDLYDPASIVERALGSGDDHPLCRETLECFCEVLGSVAGDFALQLGAQGGVYIAGGIAPRIVNFLQAQGGFRARFEAKGRFAPYLAAIPTHIIVGTQPGLIGAASLFDQP